jgi:hypothetical protein
VIQKRTLFEQQTLWLVGKIKHNALPRFIDDGVA